MFEKKIIIAGDSRVRGLETACEGSTDIVFVSNPGAKIHKVFKNIKSLLSNLHSNIIAFVVIVAGICNITKKSENGELSLCEGVTANGILKEFLQLKHDIKDLHPKSIVTFTTIAPVNLEQHRNSLIQKKLLTDPTISRSTLDNYTNTINKLLVKINHKIEALNKVSQLEIRPQTASLHKFNLKLKKSGPKIIKCSLKDGIHASDEVNKKSLKLIEHSVDVENDMLKKVELNKMQLKADIKKLEEKIKEKQIKMRKLVN